MFYLIFILNIFIASGNDGTYYLNKGLENKENYAEAEVNFKTAIELFRKENNFNDLAQTYYYLGYLNELSTNYDAAINYLNQSLFFVDQQKNLTLQFKIYERLTTIYIFLNLYANANTYLIKNSDLIKSNKLDSLLINRHYYTQALYFYYISEYGNAYQALNKIDDKQIESFELSYYNLFALIFNSLKDYNNAEKYYSILYKKDSTNTTYILNYTTFLYEYNNNNEADLLYKNYLTINDEKSYINRMINNILHSEVLYYRGEYHKSLLLLDSIRPFFEENKMYSRLAECLVVYKNNYRELKRYEDYDRVVEEILSVKDKQINSQLETVSKINDALFNLEKENLELSHQNDIYTLTTYSTIAIFILTIVVVIIAFIKRRKTNEYKQKIKQIDAENQALKDIIDNDFHNALDSYHETIYSNLDANKDSKVFNDFDKLVKIKKQINDFLSNRNKKIF